MLRYVSAIIWKEFNSLKNQILAKVISQLGITFLATIIFIAKIGVVKTNVTEGLIKNFLIYLLIIIGYVAFISNLRFWQEKSLKTLESLLATPIPIKLIVLSKVLAPTIISSVMIVIHYILYSIFILMFININMFNDIQTLIIPLILSIIFDMLYGIINGYGMWCASLTMAKFLQFVSVFLYLGSILSMIAVSSATINYTYICCVYIVLFIFGMYCLLFTTKEKAIITLQE